MNTPFIATGKLEGWSPCPLLADIAHPLILLCHLTLSPDSVFLCQSSLAIILHEFNSMWTTNPTANEFLDLPHLQGRILSPYFPSPTLTSIIWTLLPSTTILFLLIWIHTSHLSLFSLSLYLSLPLTLVLSSIHGNLLHPGPTVFTVLPIRGSSLWPRFTGQYLIFLLHYGPFSDYWWNLNELKILSSWNYTLAAE